MGQWAGTWLEFPCALQVDVSQQGIVGSTLLAMFRKLGHPIKTVVSPVVMDAVKDKNVQSTPLEWGVPLKGKVGNGQAVFYALDITQEQISQGFIIQVCFPLYHHES